MGTEVKRRCGLGRGAGVIGLTLLTAIVAAMLMLFAPEAALASGGAFVKGAHAAKSTLTAWVPVVIALMILFPVAMHYGRKEHGKLVVALLAAGLAVWMIYDALNNGAQGIASIGGGIAKFFGA